MGNSRKRRVAKYRVPRCIFKTWNMRENKKRVDPRERDRTSRSRVRRIMRLSAGGNYSDYANSLSSFFSLPSFSLSLLFVFRKMSSPSFMGEDLYYRGSSGEVAPVSSWSRCLSLLLFCLKKSPVEFSRLLTTYCLVSTIMVHKKSVI